MEVQIDSSQIVMLEEFFNNLSTINQKKIFLAGFRKAAKPLVQAAKSNAPYRTGTLRKSIGTMAVPNEIAILVGAKKSGTYKGWHGHFTENGTVERFRKTKGGASTGKVKGTHWFEHAFDTTQAEMYDTMEKEWYEEIDRFIIRVNKKIK